jgi:hypothetical protein
VFSIDLVQISNDDLIGCASLPLTDLTEGYFEGWKEIIIPFTTAKKSRISSVSNLKIPELKLKVNMSVSRNTIACFELAGLATEQAVPLARLDNSSRTEAQINGDLGIDEA